MNKTYNVIFNKSIGEYQVTSELTSSRKKTKSSRRLAGIITASLLMSMASATTLSVEDDDITNNSIGNVIGVPWSSFTENTLGLRGSDEQEKNQGIATWTGMDQSEGNQNVWNNIADNWDTIDSDGNESSIFSNNSFVNFSLEEKATQQIKVEDAIQASGIYVSGAASYIFEGDGFNAVINETSFNPTKSSGKLVLGQIATSDKKDITFKKSDFTGVIDLTGTNANTFEGGVDVYGGTLKISHQDQLGVATLDDLNLAGSENNSATLLVADGADVVLDKQTLTIFQDKFATIQNEGYGKLMFNSHMTDGALIDNYGTLAILGASTNNLIHFKNTSNKGNQTIINRGNLEIINTIFTGNEAGSAGSLGIEHLSGNVEIKDSIFENYYDAIDSNNQDSVITLRNVDFKNNSRRAINVTAGTLNIEGGVFTGNGSSNTNEGGAIYVGKNSVATITDTNFIGNSAEIGGGAIYSAGTLNLNVTEGHEMLFKDNTVPNKSGGMDYSDVRLAENAVLNIHTAKDSTLEMNGSLLGTRTHILKEGEGSLRLLSGKVSILPDSYIKINEGTFFLGKESGIQVNAGLFSVGSSGKNTAVFANGKNMIGNLSFSSNSKAIFHTGDATGSTALNLAVRDENEISSLTDAAMGNSVLIVLGDLEVQGTGKIDVNVDLMGLSNPSAGGLYSLLYSFSGGLKENQFNLHSTITINGRDTSKVERLKSLSLRFTDKAMVLDKGEVYHGIATWNGSVNSEWNVIDENWNVMDSQQQSWKTFRDSDFVNFAQSGDHTITINGNILTSGTFFSGNGIYRFEGKGFDVTDQLTSFNVASGKLVLGQIMDQNAVLTRADFTGTVDLSNTIKNSFAKGIDVYGGTLKIASSDQLGTSLDQLKLAGTESNVATLAIKNEENLHFEETLKIDSDDFAMLHLEDNATVTFADNGQNAVNITGGGLNSPYGSRSGS